MQKMLSPNTERNSTSSHKREGALHRLTTIAATLTQELSFLPRASSRNVEALLQSLTSDTVNPTAQSLNKKVSDYWAAPSVNGMTRQQLFTLAMDHSLRAELMVKTIDGAIHCDYLRCLPGVVEQAPTIAALSVEFNDQTVAEITGALVITTAQGHTVLSIPGFGVEAFASQGVMLTTLTTWINNPTLRTPLLRNVEQRLAHALLSVEQDENLFLEPFEVNHWRLTTIQEPPFAYAVSRQIRKQLADLEHAVCARDDLESLSMWRRRINQAITMPRLFGPEAMLDLLDVQNTQQSIAKALPDWFKFAEPAQRQHCIEGLQAYEQSRAALTSTLSGALDPQQYASIRLHARIENDLGYDLDPDHLIITTRRSLIQKGETYETRRNLTQLSLYGLHPKDRLQGSDFLTASVCELDGATVDEDYPDLTMEYLARLIEELDLRASFRPFQGDTYASVKVQQLMCSVMRLQIKAQAYAAQLQGHIRPEDFELIASLDADIFSTSDSLLLQRITLARKDTLSSLLVFRKLSQKGEVERLILFTPDKPGERFFQAFDNERQMLHELVSWSASDELSQFLLEMVEPARRAVLQDLLTQLRAKPLPAEDFLTFVTLLDYDQGLRALVLAKTRLSAAEQSVQTPDWYLQASREQRQTLVALEDTIAGAQAAYKAKAHTQVQEFEAYVHQRAREKINALLGRPALDVDPDQIIITSLREQLSYTQLLRNGYDDSVNFFDETLEGRATFAGPDGVDLSALTAEKVARSVRGQWLTDDYVNLIKTTLLNAQSEGYEYRCNTSLLITKLQMSAAALRSHLKAEISAEQYAWLKQNIDWLHLNDPMTRERSPAYPLQFKVRYSLLASGIKELDAAVDILKDMATLWMGPDITHIETVQGCYILMPNQSRDAAKALLYTPQAPDGLAFRPLSGFLDTLKRKGMSDYYKDRCRLKANRALAFFLHDMKHGGNSPQPTLPLVPHMDLREVCFNRKLQRKIHDIEETSSGRSDMIGKLVWNGIEWVAVAVTMPFPIASFVVGAAMVLRDSTLALQALAEGDREAASGYVLSSMLNALGAAGDLQSGLKGFGSVLRDITAPANRHAISVNALQLKRWPAVGDLRAIDVHGEVLWAARPNQAGHAALFRSADCHLENIRPTGQFAESNNLGQWRPIESSGAHSVQLKPQTANPAHAVNVSLDNAPTITTGHAKGVTFVAGKHYISLDSAVYQVLFDSRAGFWQIVDPGNPFAFFGKQPVVLNEHGQWQVLDNAKLRGGMPNTFKKLTEEASGSETAVSHINDYELPVQYRTFLLDVVHVETTASLALYSLGIEKMFEDVIRQGRETYAMLRQNLRRDALKFFDAPPAITRPQLPAIAESAEPGSMITAIFENTNGLVISEAPTSVASKQWLIENIQQLAEQKIEVLYIQHLLTDQHVHKLQKYQALGGKTRSGSHAIKQYLERVNDGALKNGSSKFDYYHLIKAAHKHGIEVKPLNSSVSYSFTSYERVSENVDALTGQKMSTFFAHKAISEDVAAQPARRWVALIDHATAGEHYGTPGISDLAGAISIRIEPGASGQPAKITRDAKSALPGISPANADFTVGLASQTATAPALPFAAATPLDDALYNLMEGRRFNDWGFDPRAQKLTITDKGLTNSYVGDHGFELSANGQWIRAEAATWETQKPLTAIQKSLIDPHYQVPPEMRSRVHDLANFQLRGLHDLYFFGDTDIAPVREAFFDLRKALAEDAKSILTTPLPARPSLPDIADQTPIPAFLDNLYERSSGVVLGESHSSVASKKVLIENFEHLAATDVKTLYMEHLTTDLHQADLDRFAETGQMSKTLMHDLKRMDTHFETDPEKVYTFENLVIKARAHGIEVRAIDCAASYHVKSMDSATDTTRQQMMNFFASRTIRRHQEVVGQHKWIALVGNTHANTYENAVPGLAELEQGIGVRVLDVKNIRSPKVMRDPGESVKRGLGASEVFLKCDYRLEIPKQPRAARPLPVESRLTKPGMFLIDEAQLAHPIILHRSRDMTIQHTPIRYNNNGTVSVDREGWPMIHQRPFKDRAALINALEAMNLKNMG